MHPTSDTKNGHPSDCTTDTGPSYTRMNQPHNRKNCIRINISAEILEFERSHECQRQTEGTTQQRLNKASYIHAHVLIMQVGYTKQSKRDRIKLHTKNS